MQSFPLCARCPRVPGRRPIPFEGPAPCRVLFLGEGPARVEDKQNRPFAGDTGKELDNTYLPLANLPRSSVYTANATRCSRADYSNPDPVDAECCASMFLGPVLAAVKPEIVVPMGAVACSLFEDGKINLNMHHGIPRPGKWGPWRGVLFPTYHPSIGLRATSYMVSLFQDFHNLQLLIKSLR